MINNKLKLLLLSLTLTSLSPSFAKPSADTPYPFYIGAITGYGSTTWDGLVPDKKNQNTALMTSTPISVQEGGLTWGLLGGYEFSSHFAFEANYMKYADANVYFDLLGSIFGNNFQTTRLPTQTEAISIMGKVMIYIPNTQLRLFSSAGPAGIHRSDIITNNWRLSPSFSVGLNYHFTEHIMGELVGNYTAGFGESLLNPADTYFPFLYSGTARIAYRF